MCKTDDIHLKDATHKQCLSISMHNFEGVCMYLNTQNIRNTRPQCAKLNSNWTAFFLHFLLIFLIIVGHVYIFYK